MNEKFIFPTSPFTKTTNAVNKNGILPHFSSPAGMLLPKEKQPPPMYGPHGTTIPPKFLNQHERPQPPFNGHRGKFNRNHRGRGGGQFRGRGGGHRHNNNYDQPRANVQNYESQSKTDGTWCETCDRGFRSLEQLEEHKLQHQICGIDGCSFTGHAAVVKKHIEMQHRNGLFEQIKKLDSPEEIAKWREERRKRYPTKTNMELRQQVQEDKMKRGEKLTEPKNRFGNKRDRRQMGNSEAVAPGKGRHAKKKWNKKRKLEAKGPEPVNPVVVEETDQVQVIEDTNLPMFLGTKVMKDSWHMTNEPKTTPNALTSLLGIYGSDSDEEITEEVSKVASPVADIKPESEVELEDGEIVDTEETLDVIPSATKCEIDKPVQMTRKRQRNRREKPQLQLESANEIPKVFEKKPPPQVRLPRRTNTLLEKLLQPDVRHERNVLLQCVRFVIDRKMFGIGAENKEQPVKVIHVIESSPTGEIKDTNCVDEE